MRRKSLIDHRFLFWHSRSRGFLFFLHSEHSLHLRSILANIHANVREYVFYETIARNLTECFDLWWTTVEFNLNF